MGSLLKSILAIAFAVAALGLAPASADHRGKPAYCKVDHDHRAHAANYYDYFPKDRFYRAGPYRGSGVSLSVRIGDAGYDEYGYGRRYDDRRYGRDRYDDRYDRRGGSRVVKRRVFDTRYRARIYLVEEVYYRGRSRDYVCTLDVRGPEARYVPHRQVHAIADRECSRRARIRYV